MNMIRVFIFAFLGFLFLNPQGAVIEGRLLTDYEISLEGFPVKVLVHYMDWRQNDQTYVYQVQADEDGRFKIDSKKDIYSVQIFPDLEWEEWQQQSQVDIFNPRPMFVNQRLFKWDDGDSLSPKKFELNRIYVHNPIVLAEPLPETVNEISSLQLEWSNPVEDIDFYGLVIQERASSYPAFQVIGLEQSALSISDARSFADVSEALEVEYVDQAYSYFSDEVPPGDYLLRITGQRLDPEIDNYVVVCENLMTWMEVQGD